MSFVCLNLTSENFSGSQTCTVPEGAQYAEVVAAVRDRLGLSDDAAVTLTAHGATVTLGEQLNDTDTVFVDYEAPKKQGGGRPPRPVAGGRAGAGTGAGVGAGAGAGVGAGAGAGAGSSSRPYVATASRQMSADEDPARHLSPSEKMVSHKWLKAVAVEDDGVGDLHSAAGLKALEGDVGFPDNFDADLKPRAEAYLKKLGLSFPALGRFLSSRHAGAALSNVARICAAASSPEAVNGANLAKARSFAHRVVVGLTAAKPRAAATLPKFQNAALGRLTKHTSLTARYCEVYTSMAFLRKELTTEAFKAVVDENVKAATADLTTIVGHSTDAKSVAPAVNDNLNAHADLGLEVVPDLDELVENFTASRSTLVQTVSGDDATAAVNAGNPLLVRDLGDLPVPDSPKGAHFIVMFKHGGAIKSFNVTLRELDGRWLFDQQFPTSSSGKVSVTAASEGNFDSLKNAVYHHLDELLGAVDELQKTYKTDAQFLTAALKTN